MLWKKYLEIPPPAAFVIGHIQSVSKYRKRLCMSPACVDGPDVTPSSLVIAGPLDGISLSKSGVPENPTHFSRGSTSKNRLDLRDLPTRMVTAGIDGIYDNSFGGIVFYNPEVVKPLEERAINAKNPRRHRFRAPG